MDPHGPVKKEEIEEDDSVDKRVYPIAISTFFMGLSISCIVPVLPLLAAELSLTQTQYGAIMSITGLTRIFSNIPLTCVVDRYGRRPALILGPLITSASMFGFGSAQAVTQLVFMRLINGVS